MSLKKNLRIFAFMVAALLMGSYATVSAVEPVAGELNVTASNPTYSETIATPVLETTTYTYTLSNPLTTTSTSVSFALSVTAPDLQMGNADVSLDGSAAGSMTYSDSLWHYSLTEPAGLTVGTHTISATFWDVAAENSTPVAIIYEVEKANQTITFGPLADTPYRADFVLGGSSDSGLPITYTITGGTGLATLAFNAGTGLTTLTPTGVGTVILEANQEGNGIYNAATPVSQTLTVIKSSPVINMSSVTNVVYDGTPKSVTFSMTPSSLMSTVVVTYDGSPTPPSAIGTYSVVATRPATANQNQVSASGVLNILPNRVIYRFYNLKNGTHFYTSNAVERDNVISRWSDVYQYEGIAWTTTASPLTVYRFYNLKNGTHFYTVNEAEKATVMAKWSDIYQYEGVGWLDTANSSSIYRFYNVNTGTHFYTASEVEKANVIAKWPTIYKYEGIAW